MLKENKRQLVQTSTCSPVYTYASVLCMPHGIYVYYHYSTSGSKTPKIRGKFCNTGIHTVVHTHFQPRTKIHKHIWREKRSRRINNRSLPWSKAGVRSVFGNAYACKMPVTHILHCGSRQVLSLWTELNSNAVNCKVCASSCCRLRWGVDAQQNQCTNHVVLTWGSNISQAMSSKATKGKALDTGDTHWSGVVEGGIFTATFNFPPCVMGDAIKVEEWHCVCWCCVCNYLEKLNGLSIYTQFNCSWICDLLVQRLMVVWLRLIL